MLIEEQVISDCKAQKPEAQRKIFETYAPVLLGICRRYTGDLQAAEDVMQEAFITVFTKIKQYKGHGSFDGWIKRIAVNTALMYLRKRKRMYDVDDLHLENEVEEPSHLNVNDARSAIEHANFTAVEMLEYITELPDGFRTVFNLYAVEGYKHREIAKILNISEGTSKSQLLRARKRFQSILHQKALQKLQKTQRNYDI